jgi:hypothetical protein
VTDVEYLQGLGIAVLESHLAKANGAEWKQTGIEIAEAMMD